jgi:hypothetical protein
MIGPCEVVVVVVGVGGLVDVTVLEELPGAGDDVFVGVGGLGDRVGGVYTGGADVPDDGPDRGGVMGALVTGTGDCIGTDVIAGIVVVSGPSAGAPGGGFSEDGSTTRGA